MTDYKTDDNYIRFLARKWWNWDITPPEHLIEEVRQYIKEHPNEFRGLGPQ